MPRRRSTMTNDTTESFVKQYGEGFRNAIEDALLFLDENEAKWHLEQPINRFDYIDSIVNKVRVKDKDVKADTGYSRVGLNNV